MSVLVLGDSHLARVGPALVALLPDATVRAFGGAIATDLAAQADGLDLAAYDVVVVSIGTNDAGWREVPVDVFTREVEALVARVPGRIVLVTSPGADEARAPSWSNATLADFATAAAALVTAAGGTVIDTPSLLAPIGTDAFLDDGFHLTVAAYDLLLPAIHDAAAPDPKDLPSTGVAY
jgi:lysophospholipase L1-like esterase